MDAHGAPESPGTDPPPEEVFSHSDGGAEVRGRRTRGGISAPTRLGHAAPTLPSDGCRKKVQFADALGLDLASVKRFSAAEEAPAPAFSMPPESADFDARVRRCHVALEDVSVSGLEVRGLVRALTSGSRRAEVGARYTLDEWLSFADAHGALAPDQVGAEAGTRFAFTLRVPGPLEADTAVRFAVFCRTELGEWWDNNGGWNYTLCNPQTLLR
ncbi:protein phosphatase 1 regulatory subunit 3D-like [Scleropages formosus]|uniref:protein phosphatase 1 regulatory subunit 3D-like n=1 Tax=Scleropages formosus TaxID=113540 RepID=UPI0010FABD39|nr:protein phosphatase 1 regulatory subunit 3D-like [Scleropages formosus]XP_029109159.1 protein phosphatase 1 regulatory subunit 3D-like [Scleropages formosus]